jgi:hypothetical protein
VSSLEVITSSAGAPPAPDAKSRRKPLNAEQRDAAARRQQAKRALRKLEGAKSPEQLRELARELLGDAPPAAAPKEAQKVEPPKGDVAGVPRMPSGPDLEQGAVAAGQVWGVVAELAKGTRFEFDEPKQAALVKGTAAWFAQKAGEMTPGKQALITVTMVFGAPAVTVALEWSRAWWAKRKNAPRPAPQAEESGA